MLASGVIYACVDVRVRTGQEVAVVLDQRRQLGKELYRYLAEDD
jgi:hypothetical protein